MRGLLGFWGFVCLATALGVQGAAYAQDEETSDTDTLFSGALMLEGDKDVFLQSFGPGGVGSEDDERYAYFVGDTLYAGVIDSHGNATDLIGEFYWFESSEPRGSDFYVGVFKVRTTPALASGWRLDHDGNPLLYLNAFTDTDTSTRSFRWDWSLPMDNYEWDAYGDVVMNFSYGIGPSSEGAVAEVIEDAVTYPLQSRGLIDFGYRVRTSWNIVLWRWQVFVQGAGDRMDWSMYLNRSDRAAQNGYHEFYLVMQADEGQPFVINRLEVGGAAQDPVPFWFDDFSRFSTAVYGIVLNRPLGSYPPPPEPVAEPDEASVQRGQSVAINVLANDTFEGEAVVSIVEPPQHGKATVNPDQTITYENDGVFVGDDSFQYELSSGLVAYAPVALHISDDGYYVESGHQVGSGCAVGGHARGLGTILPLSLGVALLALRRRKRTIFVA